MADTLSASLRLRPTRIGFLVRPDDLPSIQQIFQLCTCLWGGVYNPIIPVCATVPEAWRNHPVLTPTGAELGRGYLQFFEPDVFAEAEEGLVETLGLARTDIDFVQPRIMPLRQLLAPEDDRQSEARFGLTVFDIYQELYEREFKFVHRDEHGVALFEDGTPDSGFLAAAFGAFPSTGALSPLAQAYRDAFKPVTLAPTAENWAKVLEQGMRLPLHFSRYGLDRDAHGWHQPTLFVAEPASPLDLIDLWNIRLFHPQIVPVNLSWFLDQRDFLATFIERNYRPLPGNPNGVMITPTIEFGRSIGEVQAKELIETAGLTKGTEARFSCKLWYDRIWEQNREDTVIPAKRARITAAARDLDLTLGETGSERSVQFASLSPDFVSARSLAASCRYSDVGAFMASVPLAICEATLRSSRSGSVWRLSQWVQIFCSACAVHRCPPAALFGFGRAVREVRDARPARAKGLYETHRIIT